MIEYDAVRREDPAVAEAFDLELKRQAGAH